MANIGTRTIPKGLHHLEPTVANKFQKKYPSRAPHPPTVYVPPASRIRKWNVIPGDEVRLVVGKPREKFQDETLGAKGGWRVYKVTKVDMERNKVFLEGISQTKANPIVPLPPNYDQMTDDEKARIGEQSNTIKVPRAVHYSNVQLCVSAGENVFATRIATSEPVFCGTTRRLRWDRFAAKLSGPTQFPPDIERGQVPILWPKPEPKKRGTPTLLDTPNNSAVQETLQLPSPLPPAVVSHVPTAHRARPPSDTGFSDQYIDEPENRSHAWMDSVMPLYLSEELSPRFSRAKQTAGWNARRQLEAQERQANARLEVTRWELKGRDEGLETELAIDAIDLGDVRVRGRTRDEVRQGEQAEFDEALAEVRREVKSARAAGEVFDHDGWQDGAKGKETARKQARKQRKERKLEERLGRLTLEDGKNMVVPPDLRA